MLEAAGYAKYGQETLISGVTGEEMACDIYMGVVYYQRLRHMVSDKFQVRGGGLLYAGLGRCMVTEWCMQAASDAVNKSKPGLQADT